jgi:hypothetical protein
LTNIFILFGGFFIFFFNYITVVLLLRFNFFLFINNVLFGFWQIIFPFKDVNFTCFVSDDNFAENHTFKTETFFHCDLKSLEFLSVPFWRSLERD